jgi:hypothetical protein
MKEMKILEFSPEYASPRCIYFAQLGVFTKISLQIGVACWKIEDRKCETTRKNDEGRVYEKASWFLFG